MIGTDTIIDTSLSSPHPSRSASRAGALSLGLRALDNDLGLGLGGTALGTQNKIPEPWVKKLGDDGMTYYYLNTLNGSMRWTPPPPSPAEQGYGYDVENDVTPTNERPHPPRRRAGSNAQPTNIMATAKQTTTSTSPLPVRQRSGSTSAIRPLPRITALHRPPPLVEPHSDDSEVYSLPRERQRSDSLSSTDGEDGSGSGGDEGDDDDDSAPTSYGKQSSLSPDDLDSAASSEVESVPEENLPGMSSTERLAQLLQNALAPDPPELITDLSDHARDAVREVLGSVRMEGLGLDERTMDGLVMGVVLAIRNLIYVAAVSAPLIPSHVLPKGARARRHTTATQNLLKAPQRKVTATLAKLVLSARAMEYDSASLSPASTSTPSATTPHRIKTDAEELDRCIVSFVQEVQRCVQHQVDGETTSALKRLCGYFSTSNIGLGLVGAGVGGSWKGLGWVALDGEEEPPGRILGSEVVGELDTLVGRVQGEFDALHAALRLPPTCKPIILIYAFW